MCTRYVISPALYTLPFLPGADCPRETHHGAELSRESAAQLHKDSERQVRELVSTSSQRVMMLVPDYNHPEVDRIWGHIRNTLWFF